MLSPDRRRLLQLGALLALPVPARAVARDGGQPLLLSAVSDADDRPLDLESLVEELEAVVDAHGEPRVALLGASGAAPAAIAYAVRHPERVSHLVLLGGYLNGALTRSPSDTERAYLEAQWRLIETGWSRDDAAVREFFTRRFVPDATADVKVRSARTRSATLTGTGSRP